MLPDSENRLLAALSPASRRLIESIGTDVKLPLKSSAYRAEEMPQYCYFMTSGIMSLVTVMEDGLTAEVGLIGREGVTGGLHLLGQGNIPTDAFVQLDATALRVAFSGLRELFSSSEEIRGRLLEFVQVQAVTTSQIAGCNRLHTAEERLARWMLMAQDRIGSDVLQFTQEFLAMMLGSRRTTVTVIAGVLQNAGLIRYQRGRVQILDRPGLEGYACDCYQVIKRLHHGLYQRSWDNSDPSVKIARKSAH
jgi:CRP-like cAMP-binding protein